MKFKKKPVVIDADQLTDESALLIIRWITDNNGCVEKWQWDSDEKAVYIETLEGVMKASENDFIIKGVNGEFYPCKPEIFKQTYELV
jgi:hypothetical protein